jgi:hypothetical protein
MCEEVIKEVNSVFKYILPDTCSDAEKKKKSITAEEVVKAIKAGKDVEIKNAVITDPFILKSVNVEGEITIKNTKIKGPIDWSYATFKRVLNLENSIFETDATFTAVKAEKDIFLYSLMVLLKKGSHSVKALLWVMLTLEGLESVVLLSSEEPSLSNGLASKVPRSMGMFFLTRICLT